MEITSEIYVGVVNELVHSSNLEFDSVISLLQSAGISAVHRDDHITAVVENGQQLTIEKMMSVAMLLATGPAYEMTNNPRHRSPHFWSSLILQAAGMLWLSNPSVRREFFGKELNDAIDEARDAVDFPDFSADFDDGDSEEADDQVRSVVVATLLQVAPGIIYSWEHVIGISVNDENKCFTIETARTSHTHPFDTNFVVDGGHLTALMIDAKLAATRLLGC
jgi:hypothetical protein